MTVVGDPEAPELVVPTHNVDTMTVTVVWYESKEAVNKMYKRLCISQLQDCEETVLGFAHYDLDERTCTVHAQELVEVIGVPVIVFGHEVAHCFLGSFHE